MKKQKINYSKARRIYLKTLKKDKFIVIFSQIMLFLTFLGIWQLLSDTGVIDPFFFSSPIRIAKTFADLISKNNLWIHVWTSLYETIIGFVLATSIGFLFAVLLWSSDKLRKIFEPY